MGLFAKKTRATPSATESGAQVVRHLIRYEYNAHRSLWLGLCSLFFVVTLGYRWAYYGQDVWQFVMAIGVMMALGNLLFLGLLYWVARSFKEAVRLRQKTGQMPELALQAFEASGQRTLSIFVAVLFVGLLVGVALILPALLLPLLEHSL